MLGSSRQASLHLPTTAPPLLSSRYTDWQQHQSVHSFYTNNMDFNKMKDLEGNPTSSNSPKTDSRKAAKGKELNKTKVELSEEEIIVSTTE